MSRMEATNARSRRTRDALLAAARTLLEDSGPASVTMAAVSELANVSRRAVYLHFESRGALINALFDYVNEVEELGSGLQWVFAAADCETMLRRYAEFLMTYVPRILPVSRAIHAAIHSDPDAAQHWATAIQLRRDAAAGLVRRILDDGRLASQWTAADAEGLLLALMSNDVIDTFLTDCAWPAAHAADRLGTLFCSTLLVNVPD